MGIGPAHQFLGGAGLAGHGEPGRGRLLGGAAGLGHRLHNGQHLPGGVLGEDPPDRVRRILFHFFPLGADDLFHQVGLHEHPVVAHGRQGHGHLEGRDGHALAEGQGGPVNGGAGQDEIFHQAGGLPGEEDAGAAAEAKITEIMIQAFGRRPGWRSWRRRCCWISG